MTNGLNLDISNFYWRRLRRLYPALVVMLIFTASYITLFAHKLMGGLRGIIGSNLIYVITFLKLNMANHILKSLMDYLRLPIYGHYRLKDNFILLLHF